MRCKSSFLLIAFIVCFFSLFAIHPKYINPIPFYYLNSVDRADTTHGFDVTKYELWIKINDSNQTITGKVKSTLTAQQNLTSIAYNLESLIVDSVFVDNLPVAFSYQNGQISIPHSYIQGQVYQTVVVYHGHPVLTSDGYSNGMTFANSQVFTVSDPNAARFWWPCYDHPWDKAIVDLHVTIRNDWLAACNGLRASIVDNNDGTKTHNWLGSNPMATYLVSIAAANYMEINQSLDQIPIQNFVFPYQYNNALVDFTNLPLMIQTFQNTYGQYPFEKYGNAIANISTFSAMEHQTMTTLGTNNITGNHSGEMTIAHELAHQWYGDCLTPMTYKDVWLSESFATYSEAVYAQAIGGYQTFCNYVLQSFQNYYKSWEASAGPQIIYDPEYLAYYNPPSYEKGACVLHMLRLQLGNDAFFQLMRTYFTNFHNQCVDTEDFINLAEQISGQNLEQFFRQWIYNAGTPSIEFTSFTSTDGLHQKILLKTISNTNTDFWLKIPVIIQYNNNTSDSLLLDGTPSTPFCNTITLNGTPSSLLIDPNNWVFTIGKAEKKIVLNSAYAANGHALLTWNALWDNLPIDGYAVYRSTSLTGPFTCISNPLIPTLSYIDTTLTSGITYYYQVTAFLDGFESSPSNIINTISEDYPFDQGILVIDETKDGSGILGNPTDAMVDDFYSSVLPGNYTVWDVNTDGVPSISVLKHYPYVIWHDDDFLQHKWTENTTVIGDYLIGNGKLLLSTFKSISNVSNNFLMNFLGITSDNMVPANVGISGVSSSVYPSLSVNTDKLMTNWNGILPFIHIFPEANNSIYQTISNNTAYDQVPCALSHNGFVLLGFPLYYMNTTQVQNFLSQILQQWQTPILDNLQVNNICMMNVYPNPYIAGKRKELTITIDNTKEEIHSVDIFNIRGQKIRTITPANKGLIAKWDAHTESGRLASSGVYFARINLKDKTLAKKFLLLY